MHDKNLEERRFPTTQSMVADFSPDRRRKMEANVELWRDAFCAHQGYRRCVRKSTDYFQAQNSMELTDWFLCDAHEKLDAKACLLFRTSPAFPNRLVLESAWHDLDRFEFAPITLAYSWHPKSSHIALQFEQPILQASSHLEYLFSESHYCMLDVPLVDRDDKLGGLIRVVRSRDWDDPFTEQDRTVVELLAEKYVTALSHLQCKDSDDLRFSTILEDLDSGLIAAPDDLAVGKVVLQQVARLVRADRGDLVMWDESAKDLVIVAQYGKSVHAEVGVARPVPSPSVIREVWSKGGHIYLPTVEGQPGYYPADPRTKSEMAFRFDWSDRAIGVLNIESYREDGFQERNVRWMRLLSQYASIAKLRTGKDSEQLGLLAHLTEQTTPATDVLKLSLQGVKAYWGYDAGLIYYADFAQRQLICVESIGCDHLTRDHDITNFRFRFDECSLACKVFHEKQPYFSKDPTKDEIVSQRGVEYFQINSPLIGVPLLYEGRGVGVMVVWTRQGAPPHPGAPAHLAPFVKLAAPSIAAKTDRCLHEAMVKAAQDMLNIRQTSNSDEELLHRAIEFIHKAGFDRVRLFRFDATERAFVGCTSVGMNAPEEFLQQKIFLAENPYARDTAATAIADSRAREYHTQFGPDPDAQRLEKDTNVAWLVVPLVVHQRLYGQVVVDNAQTGRAFERQDFEYLNFLATLLAETLANAESVETMRQRALPVLLRHLHIQDSLEAYIRRFLVFITSGRGLGFSRALFLQLDQSERRLGPYDGIGSITAEEFQRIAKEVAPLELDEQLQRALAVFDESLNLALADFSFHLSDDQRRLLLACEHDEKCHVVALQTYGDGALVSLAEELSTRIEGSDYLVAPLCAANALSGLFVVDRNWQERRISDTDHALLEGFVELAEFLLTDHAHTRQFVECMHEDALVGQLARTLSSSLESRHLRELSRNVKAAQGQLAVLDYVGADSILNAVEQGLAKSTRSAEWFEGLWQLESELRNVNPRTFISEVITIIERRSGESAAEILIRPVRSEELQPLPIFYESLWRAVYVVLINALEALEKVPDNEKCIEINIEKVGEYLNIEILDTGPGIDDEVLRARRYKVDAYTTEVNKGLGLGLLYAQTVVEYTHGGCFEIMKRRDRRGTRVLLRLPFNGRPKSQPPPADESSVSGHSKPATVGGTKRSHFEA